MNRVTAIITTSSISKPVFLYLKNPLKAFGVLCVQYDQLILICEQSEAKSINNTDSRYHQWSSPQWSLMNPWPEKRRLCRELGASEHSLDAPRSEECPIPASLCCTCFYNLTCQELQMWVRLGKRKVGSVKGEEWNIERIGWEEGHGEMLVPEYIT